MFNKALMLGGAKQITSKIERSMSTTKLFIIGFTLLLLKVLVVQWSYNNIVPKLTSNMGGDTSEFKPLTFNEALMFCLLVYFLFSL